MLKCRWSSTNVLSYKNEVFRFLIFYNEESEVIELLVKMLKPLSFIPAILLMYMIFCFSAQDGETSSNLSYQVSYTMVEAGNVILDADLQPSEVSALATRFNGVVRKLAHMSEYFALAIAVSFPLYVYGLHGLPLMFAAGLFCVLFACGDEYHQSFVNDRGPSVRDVLIDSFGVFWGIILVRIIGWTGRHTIFRPFNKKKKRGREEAASGWESASNPYMNAPQGYQSAQSTAGYSTYNSPGNAGYNTYNPQAAGSYNPQASYPHGSQPPQTKKKKRTNHSDSLSEDMSLKNLIQNLRDGNDE